MTRSDIVNRINSIRSLLCVGLDTDIKRIPSFLKDHYDDPVYEFNRRIIAATKEYAVSYKFNIAFYESMGIDGWRSLERSLAEIPYDIFTIADAKRGDIGNTSRLYARTFFEHYNFDAITVSPYMGSDSLEPFYGYDDKWVIILGLTSNVGASDYQLQALKGGRPLYQEVIRKSAEIGDASNTMFVVGATKAEYIKTIRDIVPDHFFLMPGIGKQGGSLEHSIALGAIPDEYGLLINSSRGIIYAGDGPDFDEVAGRVAQSLQTDMSVVMEDGERHTAHGRR